MIDNDGRHIMRVITSTECRKHGATPGHACYMIPNDLWEWYRGVCGARIKKAGFNGKITEKSLSLSRRQPEGRSRNRSRA